MSRTWVPVLVLAAVACGGEPAKKVTYYSDVQPILERNCQSCHADGGLAPFPLETFGQASIYAGQMANAVSQHIMPPWPPGPNCNQYDDDRSLPQADIDTLVNWYSKGAPEGDPAEASPPQEVKSSLSRIDLKLQMAEEYTPRTQPDDYHCFVFDWPVTAPTYVTGFVASPGNPSVVHHVIAFVAPPSTVARYEQLDAAEEGPGYTCYGGPGGDELATGWLGAWVPGMTSGDFPAGTGVAVQPGSKIILQVHYNTQTAGPAPDRTTLQMKVDDKVDRQAFVVPVTDLSWVFAHQMDIPAGQPDVKHDFQTPAGAWTSLVSGGALGGGDVLVWAMGLHMHTRGKTGTLSIVPGDGAADQCLLTIPAWDFHWQGVYRLETPLRVHPQDQIRLECHWDNSASHQPWVNGSQVAPKDLNWGEGTGDEMCLGLLYVTGT